MTLFHVQMHVNRSRVIAAVALLFLTSYLPFISNEMTSELLDLDKESKGAGEGQDVAVSIDWPSTTSYDLSVDISGGDTFTNLEMMMSSDHSVNKDSIEWNSLADWSHYDASYNGVNYNGTFMTTFGVENVWDFENLQGSLPQGWTSSNAANGKINDNSLGAVSYTHLTLPTILRV